jgi:hypothetical protein
VLNSPAMVAGFRSRLAAFGVQGALNLSSDQGNDNTGAWTTDMFAEAVYTSLKQTEKWTATLKCDLQSQGDKFWRPNRVSFLGVCVEP